MRRRGRIRRKSSNRPSWENLDLRREYLSNHPWCELANHLPETPRRQRLVDSSCVHHVVHVGYRADVLTNMIAVSDASHRFCHENPVEGVIVCLWKKWTKGEFDRDELRRVWGRDPVGWVEVRLETHDLSDHFREFGESFVEGH